VTLPNEATALGSILKTEDLGLRQKSNKNEEGWKIARRMLHQLEGKLRDQSDSNNSKGKLIVYRDINLEKA